MTMRPALFCFSTLALILVACGGGGGSDDAVNVDAAASLVAAPVYADCGAPAIDGVLSPGEWDRAVSVRFAAAVPQTAGGGFVPAEVRAMSDDENLYVAFRIGMRTDDLAQSHSVGIDANGDDIGSDGDDGFGFTFDRFGGEVIFTDFYRVNCTTEDGQAAVCGPADADPLPGAAPGTNDGGAQYAYGENETVIEEWHPYTGQDPLDVVRQVGQSLGMEFSIRLLTVCDTNVWPESAKCLADSFFPPPQSGDRFRPIVLGCGAAAPDQEVVELQVSGGTSSSLPVIDLGSTGRVSAVVLGSERFDASAVDPASVWLAGAPVALNPDGTHAARFEDANGDGFADFVAEFAVEDLQLATGAPEATVAGRTVKGLRFHGTDGVEVVAP